MNNSKIDLVIATCIILLIMFGLIMVFSASSMLANSVHGDLTHFLRKQVLWAAITVALIISFSKIDYRILKKNGNPVLLLFVSIVLLAGLFFFGKEINGARRWYSMGIVNFQPSELARIALIIYLAFTLSQKGEQIRKFREGLLTIIMLIVIVAALIFFQPDLSTSLMIVLVSVSMLFLAGARMMHLLAMGLPAIPLAVFIMQTKNYQWERIIIWLKSLFDPMAAFYQIRQSMIGLGRGGWAGVGIGESKQKFFFLPDSHTDFIFSIIGEEFGFIGTSAVLFVFLIILYRGLRLARITRDPFGQLLAAGITLNIALYALINTAVVTNMVPATGLPMPFISYGGSHLVFLGIGAGILLNISRQAGGENWDNFKAKRERLASTFVGSS
jgi:cell division protein FtsW